MPVLLAMPCGAAYSEISLVVRESVMRKIVIAIVVALLGLMAVAVSPVAAACDQGSMSSGK